MSRLTLAAAALALAICGLAATPAAALEAGCLWSNLPEAKRAALLADYRTRGMESLQSLKISDADVATWPSRCGGRSGVWRMRGAPPVLLCISAAPARALLLHPACR